MSSSPLLSICIPTYNRSSDLRNCIESIVKQNDFTGDNVEIIISDNASTDETYYICNEYCRKYNNIHYYRNDVNVTMENFPIVMGYANGELAKLTNDTTVFKDGSLAVLLKIIKDNIRKKPVLFFSNNEGNDIYCKTVDDFLYNSSYYITWIATFSLWKEDRVNIRKNLIACDKFLWQVPVTVDAVIKHRYSVIINRHLFDINIDSNKRMKAYNDSLFQIFYVNYMEILKNYLDKSEISTSCYLWLEKDLLFHFFTNWLILYNKLNKKNKIIDGLDTQIYKIYNKKSYYFKFRIYYLCKFLKITISHYKSRIRNCMKNYY